MLSAVIVPAFSAISSANAAYSASVVISPATISSMCAVRATMACALSCSIAATLIFAYWIVASRRIAPLAVPGAIFVPLTPPVGRL